VQPRERIGSGEPMCEKSGSRTDDSGCAKDRIDNVESGRTTSRVSKADSVLPKLEVNKLGPVRVRLLKVIDDSICRKSKAAVATPRRNTERKTDIGPMLPWSRTDRLGTDRVTPETENADAVRARHCTDNMSPNCRKSNIGIAGP